MKLSMIVTLLVIIGLGIAAGASSPASRSNPIVPRPHRSSVGDPFAPIGLARANSSVQQASAGANPDAEFTTTLNEPVVPGEYNGDVRKLPPVSAAEEIEFELHQPQSIRKNFSAANPADAANKVLDVANNIPLGTMPSPIRSFAGMSYQDDCGGALCGAGFPPDTNGDVGLNHYVEAVNLGIAIYDKTGTRLAGFTEQSLWNGANTGTPCDNQSHGDPVVIYDQFADRWIISNFAFGFDNSGLHGHDGCRSRDECSLFAGRFGQRHCANESCKPKLQGGWHFIQFESNLFVDTRIKSQPYD